MRLNDYLNGFSIEDLREMAGRRNVRLSPEAARNRQTLVRTLGNVLGQYDGVYGAVVQLNQAELAALRHVLQAGRRPSLSGLVAASGADEATAKAVLDSLRLWGLIFPEGDWEHIAIPPFSNYAQSYLMQLGGRGKAGALELAPPPLQPAPGTGKARPGSLALDLAEFTARVARARFKLTMAARINRRDLKAMAPAFPIANPGYPSFLSWMADRAGLLDVQTLPTQAYQPEMRLRAARDADAWLGLAEPARTRAAAGAWNLLQGYAENLEQDPEDAEYVNAGLTSQRGRMLTLARGLQWGEAVTVESLAHRLAWMLPVSFMQWDCSRDAGLVAARMVRSLHWLGILAVDDPEKPAAAALTPLGARWTSDTAPADVPAPVPEEPWFFLQPNAEAFAPPNLHPRTLLHLRRITGEKKGGAAGMFPITADSVRRALDSGLTVPQIVTFLEKFSRTGLPSNVRSLVETAGRQHGRIRLAPAGYVLVTDEPALLEELRRLKTVAPLVGPSLVDRAAVVKSESVPELMRNLRARGYAPADLSETGEPVPLPQDPDAPPPPLDTALLDPDPASAEIGDPDFDVPISILPPMDPIEEPLLPVAGERVTDAVLIRELLENAAEEGLVVELEYQGSRGAPKVQEVFPDFVDESHLHCWNDTEEQDTRMALSRIHWARLTGEWFDTDDDL